MKQKAPANVDALAGATVHTAEAIRTRKTIIGFFCVDRKRSTDDMPQLPN
jgi:hypothetical protein